LFATENRRAPVTFTIAIDGPAGAGKGTLSRRRSPTHYRLSPSRHRPDLSRRGQGADRCTACRSTMRLGGRKAAREVELAARSRGAVGACDRRGGLEDRGHADGAPGAGRKAARLSPRPPGTVLDGRDIGTVVCPDADR
jgi:cytidylate kinase